MKGLHTNLSLLRLGDDDLPRLDCGGGCGCLLARLLALDLDSCWLLGQSEVVLDGFCWSHSLADLLLRQWRRRWSDTVN